MVTLEELEQRVRLLEVDSRSEKQVSHTTLEKIIQIGGAVNLLRLELRQHGGHIVGLQQDVTVIRNETVALRRGQEETHARIDRLEATMDARFDAVDARFDAVEARFNAVDARFNAVDARFNAIDARFDATQAAIDARFDATHAEMDARFNAMQAAMDARFDAVLEAIRSRP